MSQQKIAVNVSRIEQLSPTIKMFEFVAKETLLEPFSAGEPYYGTHERRAGITAGLFVN
ncbi:hypothetical protein PY546_21615 [Providencia stuartii]|nr:hypothetical protein [Providencia stuartii]